MNEIRMILSLKNNILLKEMEKRGFFTNASAARFFGLTNSGLGNIINLKSSAVFGAKGGYLCACKKIADKLNLDVEYLFPAKMYKYDTSKVSVEIPFQKVLMLNTSLSTIEEDVETKILGEDVHKALSMLPNRTSRIIRMKFFENIDNTQIAIAEGVSKTTIANVISKGLETIRKSEYGKQLSAYIA